MESLYQFQMDIFFFSQDPVSIPLKIKANGKIIGHERLVNVEGKMGVQMTKLI